MTATNPEREFLTALRDDAGNVSGRAIAISQLLRLGWPVSAVGAAVKQADAGDIEGALDALLARGAQKGRRLLTGWYLLPDDGPLAQDIRRKIRFTGKSHDS